MTPEILELLFELIDTRIAEHAAKDSSDGGLFESINASIIKENLRELVQQ